MGDKVFLHYTQEELDVAYDQRAWASNAPELMARWHGAVDGARAACPGYREIAYGAGAAERLDLYPAAGAAAPIHVHVHGGAWRIQSKEDGAFAAPAMTAAGMHFVVPGFDKLPGVRMPVMVQQLARALAWVYRNAEEIDGDRRRILLSGHSSGAHLAAVLATLDWSDHGVPPDFLLGLVCISGGYDLGPVLLSARRDYIELDADEVDRFSPPRHASRIRCPVTVMHGGNESPEFVRQAHGFADALAAAGRLQAHVEVPGRNHFEMVDDMGNADSLVFRAILDALGDVSAVARPRLRSAEGSRP